MSEGTPTRKLFDDHSSDPNRQKNGQPPTPKGMPPQNRLQQWQQRLRDFFTGTPMEIFKRLTRLALWGIAGFFAAFFFLYLLVYIGVFGKLPNEATLRAIQNPLASEIYAIDGSLLGKFYIQNRSNVNYRDIPPHVLTALIATEDARFFKHEGIDARSMARVAIKSILFRDDSAGGGSTISQQLIKSLFPRQNYGLLSMPVNKMREAIIARRLEGIYTKEEILALYLNTVSFGEDVYGIGAASQRFFDKNAKDLELQEAATLIGMLKATTSYSPRRFPEKSLQRRNVVLDQMVKYGYLDSQKGEEVKKMPLGAHYKREMQALGIAAHLREKIRQDLQKWCEDHTKPDGSPYNLFTDALKIYTTIDAQMQQYAEEAVRRQMSAIQTSFNEHWKKQRPWGDDQTVLQAAKEASPRYHALKEQGKSTAEIEKIFNTPIDMSVFVWDKEEYGQVEKKMSPMDSIAYYLQFLNAGFMAMNPQSGEIKAWVGSINYQYFQYDHVLSKRQVGSTFKPIVYAAAIENGGDPCKLYPNELRTYGQYEGWTPGNSDGQYGGEYSMKGALANSVNTVSVQIMLEAGVDKVVQLAKDMGINSNLPRVPSLTLGTADISLYEMIAAYAPFANGGYEMQPLLITAIKDQNGEVLENFRIPALNEHRRVLKESTAYAMSDMLRTAVSSGTAQRLGYKYGVYTPNMGGKTGTTQSNSDGWFICISPELISGAWVGGADRRIRFRTGALGQGASTALPIVGDFLKQVVTNPAYKKLTYAAYKTPLDSLTFSLDCELYLSGLIDTLAVDSLPVVQPVENLDSINKNLPGGETVPADNPAGTGNDDPAKPNAPKQTESSPVVTPVKPPRIETKPVKPAGTPEQDGKDKKGKDPLMEKLKEILKKDKDKDKNN